MIRPSLDKGYVIFLKDLVNGMVKKRYYSNVIEYLIYRHRPLETKLVLPISTRKELENQTPIYLHSIIVSKDNTDHLTEEKDRIFVKGIKFDGEDLHKYLSKTNRSL